MERAAPITKRILSFDPGTTNLGWAIGDYQIDPIDYRVRCHGVTHATRMAKKQKDAVGEHGIRLIALDVVEDEVCRLMKKYQPDYVVSEDTYFNSRTPGAHAALLLCIHVISRTLFHLYKDENSIPLTASKLHKLAPSTIKLAISGRGTSNKVEVIESVLSNPEISFDVVPVHKDQLSEENAVALCEHDADAISVGYAFAKTELIHMF